MIDPTGGGTAIQAFDFKGHEVRTTTGPDGEPWWVAVDVTGVLGVGNVGDVLARLDEDEKRFIDIVDGTPGTPRRAVINESGLYPDPSQPQARPPASPPDGGVVDVTIYPPGISG